MKPIMTRARIELQCGGCAVVIRHDQPVVGDERSGAAAEPNNRAERERERVTEDLRIELHP